MDCPTEENLIRNTLGKMLGIEEFRFNLMQRELTVRHTFESDAPINAALTSIGFYPNQFTLQETRYINGCSCVDA